MRLRFLALGLLLAGAVLRADQALADPLVPADDATLESLRAGYERMEDSFVTRENGLFLDPIVRPEDAAAVEAFFAQTGEADFASFDGRHPFEVLSEYIEHGDEGNFAGVASVGIAARLIVLREQGAPAEEIDRARQAAVRAAQAWHVYGAIGGPGVVARGVRRVQPWAEGDPPFPGTTPELTPLADEQGNPLPAVKVEAWRAPVVSGFDGWIWLDDTSKDQVSGYALAAAWLWDALHDDPEVDPQISDDLAEDLRAMALALMVVAPERGVDLCLRDADGRLTRHHDLNPREITPEAEALPEDSPFRNGFNALLALGVIRAAYHVTGNAVIGEYYYEELIGRRQMATDPTVTVALMYLGAGTNYSNVNMAAIGLATLGRFESDPYVREQLATTLTTQFWDVGNDRDAQHVEQAWFDAVYGAYAADAPGSIPDRMRDNLAGFPPAPCFERERLNCDAAELDAQLCTAIDGSTMIEILDGAGHGGGPVARDFLPMSIRPDSDFHWRSDPHTVNGDPNTKMGPRGDWIAAYWLGRASELGQPDANLSPYARPPLPYTLGEPGAGGGGQGGGASDGAGEDDGGCSCRSAPGWTQGRGASSPGWLALALMLLLAAKRRFSTDVGHIRRR